MTPNQKNHPMMSKKFKILLYGVIICILVLAGFFYFYLHNPKCMPLTASQPFYGGTTTQTLLNLSQSLGDNNPIACASGADATLAPFDGYHRKIIQIINADLSVFKSFGCSSESLETESSKDRINSIHKAYRNKDTITARYQSCAGAETIFTGLNNNQENVLYILYTAR